ncbi:MAG: TIGR01212 family radical SAM protein [Prolixibacteraceae bacterium]
MAELERIFAWGHGKRYNDFPSHFRKIFSERVQKVSIDAGFTCPNRDGTKGLGGCIYCNNATFQPSYCHLKKSITSQIDDGIQFFSSKYKSISFLAYFQAYTNTYAPLENLIELYEEALSHSRIIGLVIATRPDCLPDDLLDYLERIAQDKYVMVELGVESCENTTLERINRGHTFEESVEAFQKLSDRKIHNCAHMILGLPGENKETILLQAKKMSRLPIENIKLHQLQIHKNTLIAKQFSDAPEAIELFQSVESYVDAVVDYLELLHPAIIVERFVSQAPFDLLIAPKWGIKNFEFIAKVEKELHLRDTWQGRLFVP